MRSIKCKNCIFYYEDEVFDGENDWMQGFCNMKQDMFLAEYNNKCEYYNSLSRRITMSEITKLYENAGVEKEVIKGCYEYYAENDGIDIYTVNDCKNKDCNTCKADKSIKEYPPFTAEKQISILQFCLKWGQVHILKGINDEYRIENSCYRHGYQPTIAGAIANYINEKWEKLTPEEKQQVKGILE